MKAEDIMLMSEIIIVLQIIIPIIMMMASIMIALNLGKIYRQLYLLNNSYATVNYDKILAPKKSI